MSESKEVGVLYVGVVEVECPDCGKRTRIDSVELRGIEVACSECSAVLYISEDADFEVDEDLSLQVDG